MKKLLLSLFAIASLLPARADEGMWLPMLIGKNYEDMVRMGLKLSEEDLYSINHSSMKDAIVQFGGGCTAEMISSNGLVLTNHHCGYDAIASLSTVTNDYLDNGFWAHSIQEELPATGMTVIYLQKVIDVTSEVNKALGNATGEEFNKKLEAVRKDIEKRESKNDKYVATLKDYFNGNQYLVLTYIKYKDVRLVGTPPKSLGKFGGDTDNWMWPRHTCDFSMFRVYSGKDNEPADYSVNNVPYHPKKFLPVSAKGVNEGDFAMIFGYPGRTNRYEVSYGVNLAVNVVNPSIVTIRDLRLSIMKRHMDRDKSVYLQLTSLYARIANYWKYYIGQTEQLKRLKVVNKKVKEENEFAMWEKQNGPDADLMQQFAHIYADYAPCAKHAVYYSECFRSSALARMAAALEPLDKYLKKNENNKDSTKSYISSLKTTRKTIMKEFNTATEKDMLAEMTKLYYNEMSKDPLPDVYNAIEKYGKESELMTYTMYTDNMFKNTFLIDSNKFNAFCDNPTADKIDNDAAAIYAFSFVNNYTKLYQPKIDSFASNKRVLSKRYMHDLMEWKSDKQFYPDANSTMRITYGKVMGYDPKDGMHYKYYTTLDGLVAKYKPNDDEFDAPQALIDLYNKKDYGRYADADGTLHTCFITTDDITGGNSGSPVINANGELIGAAFDGNWEAMSGDIAFDKKYKRTIVCDARYILFIIDKLGKADNLIKEMDVHY